MALFGRRRRDRQEAEQAPAGPEEFVDDLDEEDRAYEDALLLAEIEEQERRPVAPRPQGPWDVGDAPDDDTPRIDLGGMRVPAPQGVEVRVEVGQDGAVGAATLVHGEASVQVSVFAAPRSEGIWDEVLDEIAQSLSSSGGRAERVDGPHGPELQASVPTQVPGTGGITMARVRFAGVDGPRWFLRAMYAGTAGSDPAAGAALEEAVRGIVVVRGSEPMAVRDPIPLRLPAQEAPPAQDEPGEPQDQGQDGATGLEMPERGPEITETR